MGNQIPWSQIHPVIKSARPFVGVSLIDPERKLCFSEIVDLDELLEGTGEVAAQELIAAIQQAAAKVASSYRNHRRQESSPQTAEGLSRREPARLRVLTGGTA
jgi:hypothetical protein